DEGEDQRRDHDRREVAGEVDPVDQLVRHPEGEDVAKPRIDEVAEESHRREGIVPQMGATRVDVVPDAAAAAQVFADVIAREARRGVADRGAFTIALSGGTAPWQAFGLLRDAEVPWEQVEIFQVDERVAPP